MTTEKFRQVFTEETGQTSFPTITDGSVHVLDETSMNAFCERIVNDAIAIISSADLGNTALNDQLIADIRAHFEITAP